MPWLLNLIFVLIRVHADESADMLTAVELEALGLTAETGKKDEPAFATTLKLRLDGIFYKSPSDWVIWLNGEPCYPNQSYPLYKIVEVTPINVAIECGQEHNKIIELKVNP